MFFFSSRRRHTRCSRDWSSDVCSSDLTSFVKPTEAYRQGQRTLLREYYTAPEIYGEEMERIFCRRWLCAGRAAELANSGDFVVRTVAGESLIVGGGQDGGGRAVFNVCRHPGTRVGAG